MTQNITKCFTVLIDYTHHQKKDKNVLGPGLFKYAFKILTKVFVKLTIK